MATATEKKSDDSGALQKTEGTISERFTNAVMKEFASVGGHLSFTPHQKRLAQHLFIKIDASLQEYEKKRSDQSKPAIVWQNVNMQKLAVDAVHRVELGLDALIPNHISPIPYLNGRTKKYDLDLRVGYVGKDYYRRKMAVDPPVDIRYELVYENDVFVPIKKSVGQIVESYTFEIPQPFNRGKVVGGFAYIIFQGEKKNQLVIVTDEDFRKAEAKAQSKEFWGNYSTEMKFKTLVNRATSKLQIDSGKINAAFMAVERDDAADAETVRAEIEANANAGEIIEIKSPEEPADPEIRENETPAPEAPQESPEDLATAQRPMPGF
ncbi:MAG: recombinase RecT [Thermodesulfovibrionales bacterium]|jgi:recombination protein RecT